MSLNLGSIVSTSAQRAPSDIAMIFGADRYCFEEMDGLVRRFATELKRAGIKPGDKVAMMSPNNPYFSVAYFGILYTGATVVALNTLQSADEVAFQLNDCEAKAMVLHADFNASGLGGFERAEKCSLLYSIAASEDTKTESKSLEKVIADQSSHADVFQTMPDDTAVILYTSGTTGIPKGAELTHFNLYYNAQLSCERAFSLWPDEINTAGQGDVGVGALPLYHIFGQSGIQNAMLFGGAAISYIERFTVPELVRVIVEDKATFFAGVPTMFFALLHDPTAADADLSSLRACISGGAPLPVEVKRAFHKKFSARIQEGYGLTETSPLATIQRLDETDKAGTIGKPVYGVEIKIFDDNDNEVENGERGEIVIRGHNIMKGYYNRPEATADAMRGGWFHSGDIGYYDDDGDVVIVDRKKDMLLRGGYNVFPREVEEVLYAHPSIREAAVIGVPDEKYGEEVKAVVSLKPGAEATSEQIIAFCKEHVAAYKYPRIVDIIDELPKGPTGKILKRALRSD